MKIEVERASDDGLSRKVWIFTVHTWPHLCLTEVREQSRATKRHKFIGESWIAYRDRQSSLKRPMEIPLFVVLEAREKLLDECKQGGVYIGATISKENMIA